MCLWDAASFGGVFELIAYEVREHIARADGIARHIPCLRSLQRHRLCEPCHIIVKLIVTSLQNGIPF